MAKAIILAAGQGLRLRPLTNKNPKCLAPLLGKTLLERQLETLNSLNIHEIKVVTGHCSERIESLGLNTSKNENFKDSNMVASLFTAIDFISQCNEDLIVSYGDIVYSKKNLAKLLACKEEIAIMIDQNWESLWSLRFENVLDDAETLIMDSKCLISEIGKKPLDLNDIQGQYTGLIKIRFDKILPMVEFYNSLDRSTFYDGKNFSNMYMTSFLQLLINFSWRVKAVNVKGGWLEVDSLEDLDKYENLAKLGTLKNFFEI